MAALVEPGSWRSPAEPGRTNILEGSEHSGTPHPHSPTIHLSEHIAGLCPIRWEEFYFSCGLNQFKPKPADCDSWLLT